MFVEALGYGKRKDTRISMNRAGGWNAAPKFAFLSEWLRERDYEQYHLAWCEGRNLPLEV